MLNDQVAQLTRMVSELGFQSISPGYLGLQLFPLLQPGGYDACKSLRMLIYEIIFMDLGFEFKISKPQSTVWQHFSKYLMVGIFAPKYIYLVEIFPLSQFSMFQMYLAVHLNYLEQFSLKRLFLGKGSSWTFCKFETYPKCLPFCSSSIILQVCCPLIR